MIEALTGFVHAMALRPGVHECPRNPDGAKGIQPVGVLHQLALEGRHGRVGPSVVGHGGDDVHHLPDDRLPDTVFFQPPSYFVSPASLDTFNFRRPRRASRRIRKQSDRRSPFRPIPAPNSLPVDMPPIVAGCVSSEFPFGKFLCLAKSLFCPTCRSWIHDELLFRPISMLQHVDDQPKSPIFTSNNKPRMSVLWQEINPNSRMPTTARRRKAVVPRHAPTEWRPSNGCPCCVPGCLP